MRWTPLVGQPTGLIKIVLQAATVATTRLSGLGQTHMNKRAASYFTAAVVGIFCVVLTVFAPIRWRSNPHPTLDVVYETDGDLYFLLSELANSNDITVPCRVSNPSDSDAFLRLRRSSCTCIGISKDGATIPIGATFTLPARATANLIMSAHLPESGGTHVFSSLFDVSKNDQNSTQNLIIQKRCQVFPDIAIDPKVYRHDTTNKSQTLTSVHAIRTISRLNETTIDVAPRLTAINATTHRTSRLLDSPTKGFTTEQWQLDISIDAANVTANTYHPLRIRLYDTSAHKVTTSFAYVMIEDTNGFVLPEKVGLGTVAIGNQRSRKITIHSRDRLPFQIQNASCDSTEFLVGPIRELNPGAIQLDISFAPTSQGIRKGTLTLATSRSNPATVLIELSGYGEPSGSPPPSDYNKAE